MDNETCALLNSNSRGGNQFNLEDNLRGLATSFKGAYVVSLLACDRMDLPDEPEEEEEESMRGGTEAGPVLTHG